MVYKSKSKLLRFRGSITFRLKWMIIVFALRGVHVWSAFSTNLWPFYTFYVLLQQCTRSVWTKLSFRLSHFIFPSTLVQGANISFMSDFPHKLYIEKIKTIMSGILSSVFYWHAFRRKKSGVTGNKWSRGQ